MKTIVIVLAILITSLSFGQATLVSEAEKAKIEQEINGFEDKQFELYERGDLEGLINFTNKSYADGYVFITTMGSVKDKAWRIKRLTQEVNPSASNEASIEKEDTVVEGRQIHVSGDIITVTTKAGNENFPSLFTRVYQKQANQLKLITEIRQVLPLKPNEERTKQEILSIEDKWLEVNKSNDDKALAELVEKLTVTNFTMVNANGSLIDKATALNNLRASTEKKEPWETLKQEEKNLDVYRDAAIYSAKVLFRTQADAKAGKAPTANRLSRFYIKENGEWKIARYQFTPIATK